MEIMFLLSYLFTETMFSSLSSFFLLSLISKKRESFSNICSKKERLGVTKDQNASLQLADLVTFTEEILNGKLHFLCSACVID